jgi:4-carboxymuconolactone decarboxylase
MAGVNPDERYQDGRDLILEVWGEQYGDEIMQRLRGLAPDLERQIVEFLYGYLWTRKSPPAPDRKTRSLVTIGVLSALHRPHQLRIHVVGALNNGASETEIVETILQAGMLAGLPTAWDGLAQARKVFEEYRAGAFHQSGSAAGAASPSFDTQAWQLIHWHCAA